ncbi:MAG: hypothetical protein ACLR02_08095 [Clostridium sp.]|nr:hypothetical protein [Clostridium sp.]
MNKQKIPTLFILCIVETLMFMVSLALLNINLYIFIISILLIICVGVTGYYFCLNIKNVIIEENNKKCILKNEIIELVTSKVNNLYVAIDKSNEKLIKGEEKFIQCTNEAFEKIINIQEKNGKFLEIMKTESIDLIQKFVEEDKIQKISYMELLNSEVSKFNEAFTSNINTLNNKISEIKYIIEIQSKENSTNIKNLKISSESYMLKTKGELNSSIIATKEIFENSLQGLKNIVAGYIKTMQEHITGSLKEMKNELVNVNKENVTSIEESYTNILKTNIEKCLDGYKILIGESDEKFNTRLKDLNDKLENKFQLLTVSYHKIMQDCTKQYTNDLNNVISEIVQSNNEAISSNNERYKELLSTENQYIEDSKKMYSKLSGFIMKSSLEYNGIIKKMFEELKQVNVDEIIKLEESYSKKLEECTETLTLQLSENEKKCFGQLEESLNQYAKSLVDESAIAISNVQKDNNIKLQELSSKLKELAIQEDKFIENVRNVNNDTKVSIDKLINYQKSESEKGLERITEQIDNVKKILEINTETLYEKYKTLNDESVGHYAEIMEAYKDTFIIANTKALAEVEKDNIDIIKQAYTNINDLTKNTEQMIENSKNIRKDMVGLVVELQKIIKQGNKEHESNFKSFNAEFDSTVSNLAKEIQKSFRKYDEKNYEINEKIQSITDEYHELFKQIIKNQNAMNQMTKDDIELIKSFIEK